VQSDVEVVESSEVALEGPFADTLDSTYSATVSQQQTASYRLRRALKRTLDLLIIIVLFPAWALVFILLMILQKILNPGPLFFIQKRLGRHGKQFNLIKFRSMEFNRSGQDAIAIFHDMGREDLVEEYKQNRKVKDDPRITPFGNFLRKSSMDELPQLLNVIRGEMSLVGPRPYLPDEIAEEQYKDSLLLSVKPGMTSLWATLGRSELDLRERMTIEMYYVEHWSFWFDVKILIKTVPVVISARGAE
jgi:undecaprenyl-phosphate galactose phosphotransferase